MGPVGLETKNHCTGKGHQQLHSQSVSQSRKSALSCSVSSRYLAMTSEQTENFMCAVVVVYIVCKPVRLLQLFVVMSHKHSINPIMNPNPVSSH
jgi:hypothetical protein